MSGPHLEPAPAWADDSPCAKLAIPHEGACGMAPGAEPSLDERLSCRREDARVVCHGEIDRWRTKRRNRTIDRDGPAEPDVAIGKHEPRFSVVRLLSDD